MSENQPKPSNEPECHSVSSEERNRPKTRLNSPISWVGGKRLLRRQVLSRIPEHECYVEPFAGAAWVLFAKDPAISKVEVINDCNAALSNFWRCLRSCRLELLEQLKFRIMSQVDFREVKRRWGDNNRSEVERAADFFWLLKASFGGKCGPKSTFGYSGSEPRGLNFKTIDEVLGTAHLRLSRVLVFQEDFELLIDRFDREQVFFYCDPPYYGYESCYEIDFKGQHDRLAKRLKKLQGKFLLSYNDCAEIRELYSWANIEEVLTKYAIRKGQGKLASEVFISNY